MWNDNSGEDVIIAFLDTGMSVELQNMFEGRIIKPFNIIDSSANVDDENGHGTSMICAATCNYDLTGIYGIAPSAYVMPIVVVDKSGQTSGENLSEGILYAVNNSADIINISLGSKIENEQVRDAIDYAEENGVIVVSAVGDYHEDKVLFPARYNSVIAVQAQSKLGIAYKEASWGEEVDILIPGEFIKTIGLDIESGELYDTYKSGSSISTAIMSGIIALLISSEETFQYGDIRAYIREMEFNGDFINVKRFVTNGR